jgi:beta-galactosidase
LIDREKGLIKVTNRGSVKNANAFTPFISIQEDGITILEKQLPLVDLLPGKETTTSIASYFPKMKPGAEYYATIHFKLSKDETWEMAGYEIASDQFLIKARTADIATKKSAGKMTITESIEGVSVRGKDFSVHVSSRLPGGLTSYVYKGVEQIKSPLLPHFSRPLTDNDRRGWKANRKLRQWYEYELKPGEVTFASDNMGRAVVTSQFSLINDSATIKVIYTINDNGTIKVDYALDAKPGLSDIPKVGMQGGIEDSYRNIEWYGRGLLENYVDRRYGFDAGVYRQPINEFIEPYVVPQENGNRTDVRWMFFHNKQKQGLLIVADSLLSMSAWPWTEDNIVKAKHTNKLKEAGYLTVNIDLVQMGVGGNDSWSDVAAPLEQYMIRAKPYRYSFYIMPYTAGKQTAGQQARKFKF